MKDSPEQRKVVWAAFASLLSMLPTISAVFLQPFVQPMVLEKIRFVNLCSFPGVIIATVMFFVRVKQRDRKTLEDIGRPSNYTWRGAEPISLDTEVLSSGYVLGPPGTPCVYCGGSGRAKVVEEAGNENRFSKINSYEFL